jgi:hypothetical protein
MRCQCGSLTAGSGGSWKSDAEAADLHGERHLGPEKIADGGYAVADDPVLINALGNQSHGWRTFVLEHNAL